MFPQCRWAPTSKFRGTTYTVQHLQEENSRRSDTSQPLSARWKRTNQLDAGTGAVWARRGSWTEPGRRELLEVVAMDPHLGNVLLSCRWSGKLPAEIREQKAMAQALAGGRFRLRPAPEAAAAQPPCPWPRSRAASSKA